MKSNKNLREFATTEITKGTFGLVINTETTPRLAKSCPYFGRLTKVTRTTNVALGWGYEETINARLVAEGKDATFESEKPKGKHWVQYPIILASDKDPSQFYLRTYMRKNSTSKSVFMLDGNVVLDPKVIADIKAYLPKSSKPTNQGVEEGNEVIVRDYKVEGIISLVQGEKEWSK